MAPNTNTKAEKDTKIRVALAFATTLHTRIDSKDVDHIIVADLHAQIKALLVVPSPADKSYAIELDARGVELWNAVTRLRQYPQPTQDASHERAAGANASIATFACVSRAFAFLLLNVSWQITLKVRDGKKSGKREFENAVRIMKIALKAGKTCVAAPELDLATRVLERAALIADSLSQLCGACNCDDDKSLAERLMSEYYVLRTMLAWKQSRLDLAEHFFAKAVSEGRAFDAQSAEGFADTLHEMGKDLLQNGHIEVAVRWLDRAYDTLISQDLEKLSMDAADLKMAIMQTLIKALLGQQTAETKSRATGLIQLMEVDYPDKLVVSLLRLELLLSEEVVDSDQHYSIISRMIRSVPLTDINITTLLYHINKLKDSQADLALRALGSLLRQRLLTEPDQDQWTEKVVLTIVWISSDMAKSSKDISVEELHQVFMEVLQAMRQPLSVAATHAAQTLLWGCIDQTLTANRFDESAQWCRLSLHPLFENCGDMNKSKICRKLIMCMLNMQNLDTAREVFYQLSESGKKEPLSRFLMYKVALRGGDTDFAAENLDVICRASTKDVTVLYACVVEAQTLGNIKEAALALQKVLSQYDEQSTKGVNLPALLRCMFRLVIGEFHNDEPPTEKATENICKIFETTVSHANRQPLQHGADTEAHLFKDVELQWFARSSYNLVSKHCSNLRPQHLVRLLNSCAAILVLLLRRTSYSSDQELQTRLAYCQWLLVCAYVTVARGEEDEEAAKQAYYDVGRAGAQYRHSLQRMLQDVSMSPGKSKELQHKSFQVVQFELEAALKLRQWDIMDELFEHCFSAASISDAEGWDTLADLVLVIHAAMVEAKLGPSYLRKILSVLQNVITKTHRAQTGAAVHLARWLRCLFQLAVGFDEDTALQCLDQAHVIAQRERGSAQPFPNVELEWLATTAFNRAVDYYCTSEDAKTKLWAEKALMIAGDVQGNGNLRQLLEENYSGLSWDDA